MLGVESFRLVLNLKFSTGVGEKLYFGSIEVSQGIFRYQWRLSFELNATELMVDYAT
jgi:hypothetical protein